jgi:hypothetical protein
MMVIGEHSIVKGDCPRIRYMPALFTILRGGLTRAGCK